MLQAVVRLFLREGSDEEDEDEETPLSSQSEGAVDGALKEMAQTRSTAPVQSGKVALKLTMTTRTMTSSLCQRPDGVSELGSLLTVMTTSS